MSNHTPLFDKERPIPMGITRFADNFTMSHLMNVYMNMAVDPDAKVAFGNVEIRGLEVTIDGNGQQWIVLKS